MNYLDKLLQISKPYLLKTFSKGRLDEFLKEIDSLHKLENRDAIIKKFSENYIRFVKEDYQRLYQGVDDKLSDFIEKDDDGIKIIWGDSSKVLQGMKSESIHVMVTSPPYYNARDYSHWKNLDEYLSDMRKIIRESYRVLDNHRVFIFNVGDIFKNFRGRRFHFCR